ncbi:OsmC family protein [Maricaulis sp.]|uniref:OsmC family protein n=1 Tax=Maricaulis sp. TaxID=1486257 RepID=UPI002607AC57|nr:OsmC family protein [Maricaulis sp.]
MAKTHAYNARVVWTGNRGTGTSAYKAYDRTWNVETPGKPVIHCSNDPLLGGDPGLPNPEDMLISALSACHMLWYLHLASVAGIVVTAYSDDPEGVGETAPDGAGRFLEATLRPTITLAPGTDVETADAIHGEIHKYCFIARSVNFPVGCEARYREG